MTTWQHLTRLNLRLLRERWQKEVRGPVDTPFAHGCCAATRPSTLPRDIIQTIRARTDREHLLCFAEQTGAEAEFPILVFVQHAGEPAVCENEAGVDESIQRFCCLLNILQQRAAGEAHVQRVLRPHV